MKTLSNVSILYQRLNNSEFEKVSDVLYNLMRGYDYGFTDSINYAFYNEMKLIKSKEKKYIQKKLVNKFVNNNSNDI